MVAVRKKDVRAFIDAVKERSDIKDKSAVLSLLKYYVGEVTQKDLDEVRNW